MKDEQHSEIQRPSDGEEDARGNDAEALSAGQETLREVRSTMRQKAREWVRRYLPMEVAGTATALIGGMMAYYATGGSEAAGAVAGAWCENIGFYGTGAIREVIHYARKHAKETSIWKYPAIFFKSLRNLIAEFGPAEAGDTVLIRPACMYAFQKIFHSAPLGILAGKLAADAVFYGIAVTAYEIRKLLWKD